MNNNNMSVELNEKELSDVTGGNDWEIPGEKRRVPKYAIGTQLLEYGFNQEIGQDSGEVTGYDWTDPDGVLYYVVQWRIKGERRLPEDEIGRLHQCWDLSR